MNPKTIATFRLHPVKYILLAAATGFGLGLSPFASGTAGALLGIPLMFCLAPLWKGPLAGQIISCLILAAAAVPVCGAAEKHFQRKDDRRIVADEYLTFPIGLIGLPLCLPAFLLAFVTNRVLDILKPFPACVAQRLPGGWGIVADDFISAAYSLALNHVLFPVVMKYWPL
jgi:phosphatidylglycerophosphatase A